MTQKTSLAHEQAATQDGLSTDERFPRNGEQPRLQEINSPPKDYFVAKDGQLFAGGHVLADLWGGRNLDDQAFVEEALRAAVTACSATLLHIHLHRFSDSGGLSGVAVLAESHISVHTWPERQFAAFDIFMCGTCDPEKALPVLQEYFRPAHMKVDLHRRGIVV